MQGTFRFSFGPWNIHEGADPFGPEVRKSIEFNTKLAAYKKLGFDGIQLHDDDAVPGMENMTPAEIIKAASASLRAYNARSPIATARLRESTPAIASSLAAKTSSRITLSARRRALTKSFHNDAVLV